MKGRARGKMRTDELCIPVAMFKALSLKIRMTSCLDISGIFEERGRRGMWSN